jgi:hypothetical protein
MQLQRTADAASASAASSKAFAELANAWRTLIRSQLDAYRPEKHYMRGPGPKWREKHACDNAAARS